MKVTEAEIKKGTKHCCGSGCRPENTTEWEGKGEAPIEQRMTQNNSANADRGADGLLEEIVSPRNLNRAYKRVKRNKGAGGTDGMKADNLLQHLRENSEKTRWKSRKTTERHESWESQQQQTASSNRQ